MAKCVWNIRAINVMEMDINLSFSGTDVLSIQVVMDEKGGRSGVKGKAPKGGGKLQILSSDRLFHCGPSGGPEMDTDTHTLFLSLQPYCASHGTSKSLLKEARLAFFPQEMIKKCSLRNASLTLRYEM